MLAWSREVRVASPFPVPRGSGVVVWRFLHGRHDSDTGPLGLGCHWEDCHVRVPSRLLRPVGPAEGLGGERRPVLSPTGSEAQHGRHDPEVGGEAFSAPAGYVSGREWVGRIVCPIPPMTRISHAGRLTRASINPSLQ